MTTTTYKGYTIKTVGISRHVYRPETTERCGYQFSDGYAQSMAAAKRWINEDIKKQTTVPQDEGALGRYKRMS